MSAKPRQPTVSKAALTKPVPKRVASDPLLTDLRHMIADAREQVARTVNSGLTILYWHIGTRIRRDLLKQKRAEYGQKIVQSVAGQLTREFGRGYSQRNLEQMIRFAEVFSDLQIAQAVPAQLSWTHLVQIIRLEDPVQRDFYAEMCRIERWSTRTLEKKIGGMLFERTALSKKPAKLARMELKQLREADKLTPELVFRDPYFLDFLGLGIQVSSYWTEALPRAEMERKLHEAVTAARARLNLGTG